MIAERNVSTDKFGRNLDRYVRAARKGPIAVTEEDEVVGFFLSPNDYEVLSQQALRRFLASRMKGPTVSQVEAEAHFRKVRKKYRRQP